MGDARFGVLAEVLHDLGATAGLLRLVRQDGDAGGLFQLLGQLEGAVMGRRSGRVGDDDQPAAGICGLELLEALLDDGSAVCFARGNTQ